jgi:hypothetical protein
LRPEAWVQGRTCSSQEPVCPGFWLWQGLKDATSGPPGVPLPWVGTPAPCARSRRLASRSRGTATGTATRLGLLRTVAYFTGRRTHGHLRKWHAGELPWTGRSYLGGRGSPPRESRVRPQTASVGTGSDCGSCESAACVALPFAVDARPAPRCAADTSAEAAGFFCGAGVCATTTRGAAGLPGRGCRASESDGGAAAVDGHGGPGEVAGGG